MSDRPLEARLRVGINARLLTTPALRGWNRYTINLLAEMAAQGVELVLYSHAPVHPLHLERLAPGTYTVHISPSMPYALWEEFWLPWRSGVDRVDLLHSTFHFGLPWASRCPRVLTLHDAIDQAYYAPRRNWKERLSRTVLETGVYCWIARVRAHHIIAVSEHAKRELVKYLHLPAEKISVTHEGADRKFYRPVPAAEIAQVRQKYGLNRPYFFYVGGWEGRKNVPFLVRAFAAARIPGVELALAGGNAAERAEMGALAAGLGLTGEVKTLGWIEDSDLPVLYAGALAFVYPSRHEGFGLQLCEAMAAGTPVLAARASSLPEVLGAGGETFALEDTGELAALLTRVAADADYRAELSGRARSRSGELSWTRTARETIAVYRKVLAGAA